MESQIVGDNSHSNIFGTCEDGEEGNGKIWGGVSKSDNVYFASTHGARIPDRSSTAKASARAYHDQFSGELRNRESGLGSETNVRHERRRQYQGNDRPATANKGASGGDDRFSHTTKRYIQPPEGGGGCDRKKERKEARHVAREFQF